MAKFDTCELRGRSWWPYIAANSSLTRVFFGSTSTDEHYPPHNININKNI